MPQSGSLGSSPSAVAHPSSAGRRRHRMLMVLVTVVAAVSALLGTTATPASALPNPEPNYVATIRCDSANPWPAPRIPVWVDVYNQIAFPSDGLPGPAIALIGSSRAKQAVLEFTVEVRVTWRNLRTGRQGTVTVPSRGPVVTWQVVLHPGSGPVAFTIHQKIGALAFVPMVNPQYSSCSGRALA